MSKKVVMVLVNFAILFFAKELLPNFDIVSYIVGGFSLGIWFLFLNL